MVHGSEDDGLICPICVIEFPSKLEFEEHRFTQGHKVKWFNRQYRINRKKFITDNDDIVIEVSSAAEELVRHNIALSTIEIETGSEDYDFTVTVKNESKAKYSCYLRDILLLNEIHIVETKTTIAINDLHQIQECKKIILLKPGEKYDVPVTLSPGSRVRTIRVPIIFQLENVNDTGVFYLGRDIEIRGEEYELRDFGSFVKGVYPELSNDELEKDLALKPFHVPSWFQRIAFNNDPKEIHRAMYIRPKLQAHFHNNFFKTQLWLEELQLQLDIQYYSKKEVTLRKVPPSEYKAAICLELIEEGLAENRPCVMERDQVFMCRSIEVVPSGITLQWYQGIVHKVTNTSLYLAFDQGEFTHRFSDDTLFNVEFTISRHPLKVCHRAIQLCKEEQLQNFLFPSMPRGPCPQLPIISPYNLKLSDNLEQLQAVQHIVAQSSLPAPYLVFGPPGTGKTVTIVEAIKQVLFHNQQSHVLACAPSNSAADIIAERLLDTLDETHVFRLYAKSRSRVLGNNASQKLLLASNIRNANEVYFPPRAKLLGKRVIVCTFITAGRIASACFPDGHFSHVILDEVGHAMEPEALVAIAGNLSCHGQLVLAGDPHQLGPVVRNLQASSGGLIFPETGLNTSYLERLMSMKMYQQGTDRKFNPRLVTKLLNNYRSHGEILKVPNDLFYNSELRVKGDPGEILSLCSLPFLPKKGFPLIFHATSGQDLMEPRSPSFYNPQEVDVVVKYLRSLLNDKTNKVKACEIGIITPYRLQVEKLRIKLRSQFSDHHKELKVGSVEDFQGEERRVILISTVRASKTHLAKDEIFKLGFLRNPKRFNVAVTRAKALIIIVGCPRVLQLDQNWRSLIDHIKAKGGYVGAHVPPPTENIDSIIHNLEKLDISPSFDQVSQRQIVEAPAMGGY